MNPLCRFCSAMLVFNDACPGGACPDLSCRFYGDQAIAPAVRAGAWHCSSCRKPNDPTDTSCDECGVQRSELSPKDEPTVLPPYTLNDLVNTSPARLEAAAKFNESIASLARATGGADSETRTIVREYLRRILREPGADGLKATGNVHVTAHRIAINPQ